MRKYGIPEGSVEAGIVYAHISRSGCNKRCGMQLNWIRTQIELRTHEGKSQRLVRRQQPHSDLHEFLKARADVHNAPADTDATLAHCRKTIDPLQAHNVRSISAGGIAALRGRGCTYPVSQELRELRVINMT